MFDLNYRDDENCAVWRLSGISTPYDYDRFNIIFILKLTFHKCVLDIGELFETDIGTKSSLSIKKVDIFLQVFEYKNTNFEIVITSVTTNPSTKLITIITISITNNKITKLPEPASLSAIKSAIILKKTSKVNFKSTKSD